MNYQTRCLGHRLSSRRTHRQAAFPRELSGGEQQRVAIARALAMRPEALLLDEPTSALDPERKLEVIAVLEALAKEGTTMVIVTHEPAVVRSVAHRAIMLRAGKVAAVAMIVPAGCARTGGAACARG